MGGGFESNENRAMIFVDSSVWIDYFNGKQTWQTDKLDQFSEEELILIGDIVLVEVLQGFRKNLDFEKASEALSVFPCPNLCGVDIAFKSANNFRDLRKRGITVRKTIDMIIGTFCIENEHVLLHDDKDFEPLSKYLGLQVVHQ